MSDEESLLLLYDYLALHPLSGPVTAVHPLPTSSALTTSSSSFIWRRFLVASNSPPSSDALAGSCLLQLYQQRTPLQRRLHQLSSTVFYDHSPTSNRPRLLKSLTIPCAAEALYPSPTDSALSLFLSPTAVQLLHLPGDDVDPRAAKRPSDGAVLHFHLSRSCAAIHGGDSGGSGGDDVSFVPSCAAWHPHRVGWVLVGSQDGWCHLYDVSRALLPRGGGSEGGHMPSPSSLTRFTAPLHSFHVCDAALRALCFSSDRSARDQLAVASDGGHVLLASISSATSPSLSSSSSPAPSAPLSNQPTDVVSEQGVYPVAELPSAVACAVFCPSLSSVLVAASEEVVRIFDLSSPSQPPAVLPHPSPVRALAVAPWPSQPLRSVLVAAACGSCVYVWRVDTGAQDEHEEAAAGEEPRLLFIHRLHSADVVSVAWQEGQPWLVSSADAGGVLHLWEMDEACHSTVEIEMERCESPRVQEKRRRVKWKVAELRAQRREKEKGWLNASEQLALTESKGAEGQGKAEGEDGSDASSDDDSDGDYDDDEDEEAEAEESGRRGKPRAPKSPKDSTSCIPLDRKGGKGRVTCPYHQLQKVPCPDNCPYRATILAAQRKKRRERDERRRQKPESLAAAANKSPQPLLLLIPPSADEPIPSTPPPAASRPQERGEVRVADASQDSGESKESPPSATLCARARCDFSHPASEPCPEASSSDRTSQESKESPPSPLTSPPAKKRLPVERLPEPPRRRAATRPAPVHHHQPSPPSSMPRSQSSLGGEGGDGGDRGRGGSAMQRPLMQSPVKSRSEPLRLTPPSPAVIVNGVGRKREREREKEREREPKGKREASDAAPVQSNEAQNRAKRRKGDGEAPPGLNRVERRQWEQAQAKRKPVMR